MEPEHQNGWRLAVRLFEAGEYWECHEALEPAWLSASGMEQRFLGGVILLAAALHKAHAMGSPRGGRRNFAKGLAKLAIVDDSYYGVNVRELEWRVHEALLNPESKPGMPASEVEEVSEFE